MNEFFRWIADNIYALWPVRILNPWERGLRTFCGRVGKKALRPGVHLFCPGLGGIERAIVTLRWVETPYQTVTTSSGYAWTFALAIGYSISNVRRLFLKLENDVDSALNVVQAAAAAEVAAGGDTAAGDMLGQRVEDAVLAELRSWGIKLHGVRVTSLAGGQALRLLIDTGQSVMRMPALEGS